MSHFKRITATLSAQLNAFLDEVENHEAVAETVLTDLRAKIGEAKYHLRRLQLSSKGLEEKAQHLASEENKWKERALRLNDSESDKALECIRRLQDCETQRQSLLKQRNEVESMILKLGHDIRQLDRRYEELNQKRSSLASRSACAEATQIVNEGVHYSTNPMAGVFDRWEKKITRHEVFGDRDLADFDSLTQTFVAEEEKEALKIRLEELKAKTSADSKKGE